MEYRRWKSIDIFSRIFIVDFIIMIFFFFLIKICSVGRKKMFCKDARRTVGCDLCSGRARRDVAGTGQDTEVLWSPWLSGFPVLYSRGDYLTVCNARARDSDALLLPAINTRRMCVPAAVAAPPANFATREYIVLSP